jgi:hypothetical protein
LAGYDQYEEQQPQPPAPGGGAAQTDDNDPFPVVPGFSLDRARFDPVYLLWGMRGANVDGQGLRGWDSREASAPLVLPLPDFGCVCLIYVYIYIHEYPNLTRSKHKP